MSFLGSPEYLARWLGIVIIDLSLTGARHHSVGQRLERMS